MNCPACAAPMTALSLPGQAGTTVEIDMCAACRAFWFDQFESLRLAPGGVLKLFELMGQQGGSGGPAPKPSACPRCGGPLLPTHDRQRVTAFQYWRCAREHGRFITFVEFLKEKDFIRPLTPQQVQELRQNVQTINCTNCGAPIDLAHDTVCSHCGSPLALLDLKQVREEVARLQAAGQPHPVDPAGLALQLETEKRRIEGEFGDVDRGGWSLVDAGIRAVADWLKK